MNGRLTERMSGRRGNWTRLIGSLLILAGGAATTRAADAAQAGEKADSPYVPAGYVNVFRDEMDGPSLDTSKWWTRYIYDDGLLATLNDERQLFREQGNHVMGDGVLRLTARYVPDLKPPRWIYTSGMIRSKMTFKYGYFEARLKVPAGLGCWPGFWLNSDADADGKVQWPPEVDILEFVNNGKQDKANMMHMGVVVSRHKEKGANPWGGEILEKDEHVTPRGKLGGAIYHAPFDFPDDFHVIGGLWDTDDTLSIFVDGKRMVKFKYKWVYQDGQAAPNAHVLLNLAIGGEWAGRNGIDNSAFPQALQVDYVRIYQKAGHQQIGRSTIGHDLLKPGAAQLSAAQQGAATQQSGPTPYPDPKDESAWAGTGPIRVFPWMKDNRAYFWTQRARDQGAIVFVGDSLVGNWKAKALKAAFPGRKVANRGIGGDVSRGVLFRLKEDVLDLNPRMIVLLVGTNDLSAHAKVEGIVENLAAILEKVKAYDPNLKVVLNTIPPRNAPKAPTLPGAVDELNRQIAALAKKHQNVVLVDLHAALLNADGSQNVECFQKDHLHLGPKGYETWSKLLNGVLPPAQKP